MMKICKQREKNCLTSSAVAGNERSKFETHVPGPLVTCKCKKLKIHCIQLLIKANFYVEMKSF